MDRSDWEGYRYWVHSGIPTAYALRTTRKIMGRNVIIWSGGADSTALLEYYAGVSSKDYPVHAISISAHPNLRDTQLSAEKKARERYLDLARKKGYWIRTQEIEFGGEL